MTVATLPPLPRRFLVGPRYKAKLKRTHCYKLRHLREDKVKLRRLGSGFFQPVMLDSLILGYLLPRMPSMLQDNEQRGVPPQILDAKLPERDDRSQHSGSFKGSKLGSHRLLPRERGQGDAVPWHDDVSSASSGGAPAPLLVGQAPLPPIGQTYTQLTPIGEASREHTQAFSLPVNDEEEDEGWAGRSMVEKNVEQRVPKEVVEEKKKVDVDKRKARISAHSLDIEGPAGAGSTHQMSSSDSVGPGSTHSSGWLPPVHKQQWKGSQQSLKSHGSRRAYASDDSDAEVPDEWKLHGRRSDNVKKLPKRESPRSHVTEQEILDKLTSHATHIAESILSHSESGQLLEEDIRRAAFLWMDTHPARDLSRSQSVQDLPDKTVIQEVMKVQKRNSAGPTVAEYRDQIKGNLMMALAKATGLQQSDIPQDAEIDPELLEQLASHTLTPDDIEIVRDVETGRSFIRSRNQQISAAMGGVEKGHIYQQANKNGDSGKPISIPSERKSGEIGEMDIVNYQSQGEEKESAKGSEVGSKKASSSSKSSVILPGKSPVKSSVKSDTSIQNSDKKSVKSAISFKHSQGQEELQQALADLDKPTEAASVKSGKSRVSDDRKSRVSDKKVTTPEKEKKDEFVVGKVPDKKDLVDLYSQPVPVPERKESVPGKPKDKKPAKAPPVGKKKVEKGKKPGKGKAKKKTEYVPEPETVIETVSPVKELTPEPPKAESPKPETPVSARSESVKQESDDDEEYIIVREETMTPEPEVQDTVLNVTTSAEEEEPDEEQVSTEDLDDMSEADKLRMISNRDARAAKRAAAAEKRRQEVERKRKEREEQIRREKDEHERQEVLRQEQEELRKQKEEERRLKRQREEEENEEQVREELEKVRREKAEVERERRRKEEYSRKLEMMKARQLEDEKRRQEEAERKRLEEEELRKEEDEKMAKMAEEERMEYERKKKEEEEERLQKEAEDKKRRAEEALRALEEARRLAEEMARKQAELEARLRFNRSLQLEANGLDHTQDITNAFIFSYFELLQWLGLDISEYDLLKLNQY